MKFIKKFLNNTLETINSLDNNEIHRLVKIVKIIKQKKGRIFFLGLGGSAANASHAVNDFRKIANIECYSPLDNISEFSARVNDEGLKHTFSKWLEVSKLTKNDLLFIFSVGGGDLKKKVSVNIVEAIKFAKKRNAYVVGLVANNGGYTAVEADEVVKINVNSKNLITPISESLQAVIWHLIVSHPLIKENETKWESLKSK